MECIAVMAVSVAVIFARLAMMQGLNPFLWGFLAIVIYAGMPILMIRRGASLMDAPRVWISSFAGLFVLFVVQSLVAERKRYAGRGGPPKGKGKGKGKIKRS
jgi:hypothetical protein